MSLTDWLIDLALIGLVVLQLRGRRLTLRTLLLPVALVAWAGVQYLRTIPTGGNDLELIVPVALLGLALGIGAGLLSHVHRTSSGAVIVRASIAAAVLWVVGVGCRLAFQVYATHGGGPSIGRFSIEHHLDPSAWTAGILLMAFGEVLSRTAIVGWRGLTARRRAAAPRVLAA